MPARFSIEAQHEPDTEWVALGDEFAIARRFTAKIGPRDPSLPACELTIAIEGGHPVCVALRCERRPGGPAVTSALLRRIPLGEYVREALTGMSFRFTRDETQKVTLGTGAAFDLDGRPAWVRAPLRPPDERDARRDAVRIMSRQPRRGIPLTDADLREVAESYRVALAAGQRPTKALMDAHHVSRATASRWVARARDRGFLGKAHPRRAGEVTNENGEQS